MGALATWFRTSPSSSHKKQRAHPHSTLDLALPPPPRPLWALATEPDLTRSSPHRRDTVAHPFGPREPWQSRSHSHDPRREDPIDVEFAHLSVQTSHPRSPPTTYPPRPTQATPPPVPTASRPRPTPTRERTTNHAYPPTTSRSPEPPHLETTSPGRRAECRSPTRPPVDFDKPLPLANPNPTVTDLSDSFPPLPLPNPPRGGGRGNPLKPRAGARPAIASPNRHPGSSTLVEASRARSLGKPDQTFRPSRVIELSSDSDGDLNENSLEWSWPDRRGSVEHRALNEVARRRGESSGRPRKAKPTSRPLSPRSQPQSPTKHISTPIKPSTSSNSSPSKSSRSPSSGKRSATDDSRVQCHGLTGSGTRCTRKTTRSSLAPRVLSSRRRRAPDGDDDEGEAGGDDDAADDDDDDLPVYCHQHAKLSLVETGCFVTSRAGQERGGTSEMWINYSDWILPDLPLETQTLLRLYMSKPVSAKDRPGYLYVHELLDKRSPPSSTGTTLNRSTYLKLGRTIHPVLRLSQWRHSCPSFDPIVRDILPRPVMDDGRVGESSVTTGQTMSGQRLRFSPRGTANCHRWERLCLVEISGRLEVLNDDGLATDGNDDERDRDGERSAGGETPSRRRQRSPAKRSSRSGSEGDKCRDCGKRHVECFRVTRDAFYGGRADSGWAIEIVERWERWCRDVLG
ncbi:hypothetical protein JCM10212_001083 [Sporobolomyces blumeae]